MSALYGQDLAYIQHVGFSDGAGHLIPYLRDFLGKHRIDSGRVVDLGCGDGQWLAALNAAGYATFGVDWSDELVAIARKRAPAARIVAGSVHDVPLPNCDAVTALGEVLGYIPPGAGRPDLGATLRRIAAALRPRGWLLFDLYVGGDGGADARHWRAGDDWIVLAETIDDRPSATATRRITAMRKDADGRYRRSDETHHLTIADADRVMQQLADAGFSAEVAEGYGEHRLPARRRAFFAQRR